jgi:hypothetical protein
VGETDVDFEALESLEALTETYISHLSQDAVNCSSLAIARPDHASPPCAHANPSDLPLVR